MLICTDPLSSVSIYHVRKLKLRNDLPKAFSGSPLTNLVPFAHKTENMLGGESEE